MLPIIAKARQLVSRNILHAAGAPAPAASSPDSNGKQSGTGGMVHLKARDRAWRFLSRKLTPSHIESILEGALNGDPVLQAELFEIMQDTWPRLMKNLNEVKQACSRIPWQVQPFVEKGQKEPSASAQEKAKAVEAALLNISPIPARMELDFDDGIYHSLDAIATGISVLEIYWGTPEGKPWTTPDGIVGPRAFKHIPARYYGFPTTPEEDDRLMLNLGGNGSAGALIDFPEDKFLVCIHQSRSGHASSTALLRSLAKYWIGATFGFQWLCNYAEIFGQPLRWATYDPNNKALLDDIVAMLENMGATGWGAFPMGTTLDLKESVRAAQDNPQAFLMEVADKACDILILGQTLTTDVGSSGSRALGQTHYSIRTDVLQAGASFVSKVMNRQLVPAIMRLNFGSTEEAPTIIMEVEEPEDEKAKAERDKVLFVDLGLPVSKAFLYERHGVPAPAEGEDLLEVSRTPSVGEGAGPLGLDNKGTTEKGKNADGSTSHTTKAEAANAAPFIPSSAALVEARRAAISDRLSNNVLEDVTGVAQAWLGPVKPIFRSLVLKAMDSSVSDADFLAAIEAAAARMPELFDGLDTEKLASALENAMGAAAVNGAVQAFQDRQAKLSAKWGA